ncbi:hypothetical protein GGG16DRAFT_121886 [Schizophyllum commune]
MITRRGRRSKPTLSDPLVGHPPPIIITSVRLLLTIRGPLTTCRCTKFTLASLPCPPYTHHHLSHRTASPQCRRYILQSHRLHRKRLRSTRAPRRGRR